MALLDRNGPLDTVSSAIILTFTTLWVLGFGLQVAPIETRMPAFLTLFGAFPASLTFASDLAVRGGGAMALVPIISNLPFFLGTENPIQSSSPRQLVNMAVWIGFFLVNYRNAVCDGNLGGWNTAFNLNWLFTNGFFALLHISWCGREMVRKLKLA